MKKIILTLVILCLGLSSGIAMAQSSFGNSRAADNIGETVLLRPDALIEGQYVTLGDLFSGIDPQITDIAVAHAPQPGQQTVLDYRWLYGIAQRHKINWRPRTTGDQILITRASQVITIDEIHDAVKIALADRGVPTPFTVELSSDSFQIHLPMDNPARIDVTGLEINTRTNRFVASITTGAATAQQRTYRISGKYYPLASVPVLVEPVSRGDIIRPDQTEYRSFQAERIPSSAIRDIQDVIGKEVLRPVDPGSPLMYRDFSNPLLVKRGAIVTIRLVTANMSLTARGKALENGSKGDVIRVVNQSSNKTIQVEVVANNEVRALPAMSQ